MAMHPLRHWRDFASGELPNGSARHEGNVALQPGVIHAAVGDDGFANLPEATLMRAVTESGFDLCTPKRIRQKSLAETKIGEVNIGLPQQFLANFSGETKR